MRIVYERLDDNSLTIKADYGVKLRLAWIPKTEVLSLSGANEPDSKLIIPISLTLEEIPESFSVGDVEVTASLRLRNGLMPEPASRRFLFTGIGKPAMEYFGFNTSVTEDDVGVLVEGMKMSAIIRAKRLEFPVQARFVVGGLFSDFLWMGI